MSRHQDRITNFESRSLLLIASLTLGAAGSAFAQSTTAPASGDAEMPSAYTKADKNSDGQLSREEAAELPVAEANFDRVDADKDGMLSPAEWAKAMKM